MSAMMLPQWMCAGPRNRPSSDPSTSLSFVSYNVLADALTGNEAGFSSTKEDLQFETRGPTIVKQIFGETCDSTSTANSNEEDASESHQQDKTQPKAEFAPDVICLQECDHYYDFFEPEFQKRGYFGIFREDKWSPCMKFSNDLKDGLAVFAKRDTCELVGMHVSTAAESKEQDTKVLFARFVMKKSLTKQEVVVINAHLDSGQSPDKVVTRVNQAKEMCSRLNAFCVAQCSNINTVQIVACGDFNATPEEPCMEHLRGRGLKSAYADLEVTQPQQHVGASGNKQETTATTTTMMTTEDGENEPFFTTFKTRLGFFKNGTSKRCSDYIMYSAHRGAKIVSREEPQQNGFGEGVIGLPSKTQPSDHLMLQARVSFANPIILSNQNNNNNKSSAAGNK